MSIIAASSLRARFRRLARRWTASDEGVAAVEFGLIVPIMAVMFIGAVELSQAITVDRRVTQVASSTADLVARFSPRPERRQRHLPDRDHRHHEGRRLHHGALQRKSAEDRAAQRLLLTHQCNQRPSRRGSCTYNGAGNSLSCACTNTTYSLPANLVTTLRQRRHLGSDLQLQAAGIRLLHEVDGNGRRSCRHPPHEGDDYPQAAVAEHQSAADQQHALPGADLLAGYSSDDARPRSGSRSGRPLRR